MVQAPGNVRGQLRINTEIIMFRLNQQLSATRLTDECIDITRFVNDTLSVKGVSVRWIFPPKVTLFP